MLDRKPVQLIVGVIAFFTFLWFFHATNLVAVFVDSQVQSQNLKAVEAPRVTSFTEFALSAIGVLSFLFSRLGAATIAFFTTLLNGVASGGQSQAAATVKQKTPQEYAVELYNAALAGDRKTIVSLVNEVHGSPLLRASGSTTQHEKKLVERLNQASRKLETIDGQASK